MGDKSPKSVQKQSKQTQKKQADAASDKQKQADAQAVSRAEKGKK